MRPILDYNNFYRQHGIRTTAQVLHPPIDDLTTFSLPKQSIFHFIPESDVILGPSNHEMFFNYIEGKIIPIAHENMIVTQLGSPIKTKENFDTLRKQYHRMARKYKFVQMPDKFKLDQALPLVVNYSLLNPLFKYPRNVYAEFNKKTNLLNTLIERMIHYSNSHNANQFIAFRIPHTLPTKIVLDNYDHLEKVNTQMVKLFDSLEEIIILEIWRYLGGLENNSKLTSLVDKAKDINKINILFYVDNKWFIFNLGLFLSWKKPSKLELEKNKELRKKDSTIPELKDKGIDGITMQKIFLTMLVTTVTNKNIENESHDPKADLTPDSSSEEETNELIEHSLKTKTIDTKNELIENKKVNTAEDNEKLVAEIDAIVDALDALNTNIEVKKNIEIHHDVSKTAFANDFNEKIIKEETFLTVEDTIKKRCDELGQQGYITAAEYKRYLDMSAKFNTIVSPDGRTLLKDYIKIDPKKLENKNTKLPEVVAKTIDTSMTESTLKKHDEIYIKDVLQKDIMGTVVNMQRAGIIINDYQVTKEENILGGYDIHSIKLTPIGGTSSTIKFKIPVIDPETGIFKISGTNYKLRRQKGDCVIRKVDKNNVAITTSIGKLFISRSEKKVNDYGDWIQNKIMAIGLDNVDNRITNIRPSRVFDHTKDYPYIVDIISNRFNNLTINGYDCNFDVTKISSSYAPDVLKFHTYETSHDALNKFFLIGINKNNQVLLVDENNLFYTCSKETKNPKDYILLGSIEEMLKVEDANPPIEFSTIKMLGKSIPVGIMLSYLMGLFPLIKKLSSKEPKLVPIGTKLNYDPITEYVLRFNDESIILQKDDKLCTLILSGFRDFKNEIKDFNIDEFNKQSVYFNILSKTGIASRLIKKFNFLSEMFIDPVSLQWLIDNDKPKTIEGLLLEASRLLLNNKHEREFDGNYSVIRSHERFAHAVAVELNRAIESSAINDGKIKRKVELNPYAVWSRITSDSAVAIANELNPIKELKESESITYNGHGGRTSQTMVGMARSFDKNDLGVISESTSESGDVGINIYSSFNPQYKSVRGDTLNMKDRKLEVSSVLSTSAALSPFTTRDDMKRVNFVAVQNEHTVGCPEYEQSYVGTGAEYSIAGRTTSLFATVASQDCKVTKKDDISITVENKDGTNSIYQLGRRFGSSAGITIAHEIKSDVKVGDKLKSGDTICYNPNFFTKDQLYPSQIVWKSSLMVNVALIEGEGVIEDASIISIELANKLKTTITKPKIITISSKQPIKDLVKIGTHVEVDTILCLLGDEVSGSSGVFDNASLDTLRSVTAQTPQAKTKGVVERIEVYYHGEKEDMCDSVRKLVNQYNQVLSAEANSLGKKYYTGQVDDSFRINGEGLMLDNIAIKIFITQDVPVGIGDKGVFSSQLKTVFSGIMTKETKTESGRIIDAYFSKKSVDNRIVNSAELLGTTSTLLEYFGKQLASELV